jgi:hypothetical protein
LVESRNFNYIIGDRWWKGGIDMVVALYMEWKRKRKSLDAKLCKYYNVAFYVYGYCSAYTYICG